MQTSDTPNHRQLPRSARSRGKRTPEQERKIQRSRVTWLAVLVLIVYASALAGSFVWSDREDILLGANRLQSANDLANAMTTTREAFRSRVLGSTADPTVGSWQPLGILSYTADWALWGDCAFCFHLENVLLHGGLVIGVFLLGQQLLAKRRHGGRIAVWAAALFAVHPATVSSVAWIGGRPYLLAALMSVWCLVVFSRLQATSQSHRRHMRYWPLWLTLTAMGAMLSHESTYVLPVLAFLIATFESRERGRSALFGIAAVRLIGLAAICGVLLAVVAYRILVIGGMQFAADYPSDHIFYNLGTALRHFWFLLDQTLLPFQAIISDARPVTSSWSSTESAALLGVLLILGATGLGLRYGHPIAVGVSWFLLAVLPGVGIFPVSHYYTSQILYLATWGLMLALAYGLFMLWRPIGRQMTSGSEAVIYLPLVTVLAVITAFSNARWWDHRVLFESAIASDPHYMEGRIELAKLALEEGQPEVAINHTLAAIEASHDASFTGYWLPHIAYLVLGQAQWRLGQFGEALDSFEASLEQKPGDPLTLYWLGMGHLSLQAYETAERSLRRALESRRPFPEAEADLGVALVGQQRFVEAYPLLANALESGLGNPRRYRAMALTMIDANRLEDAESYLRKTLAEQENASDRARAAWVAWRLGRTEAARSDLDMALELEEQTSPYVDCVRRQIDGSPDASAACH